MTKRNDPRPLGERLREVAEHKLLSVLENTSGEEEDEELLGHVDAESGILLLCDPQVFEEGLDLERLAKATKKKDVVTRQGTMAFRVPPGAYEVLGLYDENDELCEIRIVFADEDDDEGEEFDDADVIDAEWVEVRR